jgi:acyl-CoA synthetase (AMP-forming)/AMP-acid ligase II
MNLGRLLARRAATDADRPAVIDGERVVTFRALNDQANRFANVLAAKSIAPGDRIAALLRNGVEFCALYYAAAKLGAILCPLNWRLAPPEIDHIMRDSGARALVHDREFGGTIGIDELQGSDASEPDTVVESDAPLLICYTSGTTGRPKGAVLSHAQMFWVSDSVTGTLDYRRGDVSLIAVPMFHVGGLSFATMFVHRSATAVMMRAWDARQSLALIAKHRVNHFFAVPTMLSSLLAEHPTDLGSLRWLLTGAAPTPPQLFRDFAARGVTLLDSYGCTETAGAATCMGKPFLHAEVRLVDDEIQVRAPHVFSGYWNDAAATQAAFSDGWLLTGDLGRYDTQGNLQVVERRQDMIISGGENVYPAEVEQVLAAHPAIAELAVVGVPDAKWGEAVCAVAVLRPGHNLSLSDLRAHCDGKIASYKMPSRLVVREEALPRTATGKPMKHLVRAQLQAGLG